MFLNLRRLFQDEERLKKAVNEVPTHAQLNAMIARSEEERVAWDLMDTQLNWPAPPMGTPRGPMYSACLPTMMPFIHGVRFRIPLEQLPHLGVWKSGNLKNPAAVLACHAIGTFLDYGGLKRDSF